MRLDAKDETVMEKERLYRKDETGREDETVTEKTRQ